LIYVRQLQEELDKLLTVYKPASREFPDPFYIIWMIDSVFGGKTPPVEKQGEFMDIMKARQSEKFRALWVQYNKVNAALEAFQVVPMGIIPKADRVDYQQKFIKERPEEVPF